MFRQHCARLHACRCHITKPASCHSSRLSPTFNILATLAQSPQSPQQAHTRTNPASQSTPSLVKSHITLPRPHPHFCFPTHRRYFWGGTGDSDDDEESCFSDDDRENTRSLLRRGSRALGSRSSPEKGARHSCSPRRSARAGGSPGAGPRPRTGSPAAMKQHSFVATRNGSPKNRAQQPCSPVN